MGSTKTQIKNGFKFDLNSLTGFQGSHMQIYHMGRIQVQWPKGAKTRSSPDFVSTAFLDVLDGIVKTIRDPLVLESRATSTANNVNNANSTPTATSETTPVATSKTMPIAMSKSTPTVSSKTTPTAMSNTTSAAMPKITPSATSKTTPSAMTAATGEAAPTATPQTTPIGTPAMPTMPFAPQQYNIMPIILKNCLAQEIKGNPKELARIIHELKPQANIKVIIVLPSGDLLIEGESPHDFSILRQEWPDTYGRITPQLPEDKSVNQRVLIYDLPLSIGEKEIQDALFDEDLHPKNVFRFNMKGS